MQFFLPITLFICLEVGSGLDFEPEYIQAAIILTLSGILQSGLTRRFDRPNRGKRSRMAIDTTCEFDHH